MRGRRAGTALFALANLGGVVAFAYPFFLGAARTVETRAHASDAPILFSLFGAMLIAVAIADLRAGRTDARRLAALGVLTGVNAMLRLPGAIGGGSLMFVLPVLAGYAFGARFGFLLGASSFAASAAITGGIGPWLPFQMWALGWIGGGAGLLRPALRRARGRIPELVALMAYGWVAGLAFGALTNLWFWPFQQGASSLAWAPGMGAWEALRRYWRFYIVTSLAWDSSRAVLNAALIAALGRPIVRLFERFRLRMEVTWRVQDQVRAPLDERARVTA